VEAIVSSDGCIGCLVQLTVGDLRSVFGGASVARSSPVASCSDSASGALRLPECRVDAVRDGRAGHTVGVGSLPGPA
jgi:hypothetical protein